MPSAGRTPQRVAVSPLPVRVDRFTVPVPDAFGAFLALRSLFGESEVFLLESLAGPDVDRRAAVIGFRPLLDVSVRGRRVEIGGLPSLAAHVRESVVASGVVVEPGAGGDEAPGGAASGLVLSGDDALWDLGRAVQASFDVPGLTATGFSFGFLAVFGYEAVRHIERLPRLIPPLADRPDVPDLRLVIHQGTAVVDLATGTATVSVGAADGWPAVDVPTVIAAFGAADPDPQARPPVPPPISVDDSTDVHRFVAEVATCLDHIGVGDIYQVQVGHELTIRTPVDDITVYRRLRWRNPSPYMYFLPLGEITLLGASPELFVRVEGDVVAMRPIAGTASRSGDRETDESRIAALRADDKEVAEHVMLVDLSRNDLGKVARAATVEVDEMMVVEDFSHVFHLVSNVKARLAPWVDAFDVVRATFPAGTMTGAPKVRAMEIIEEREDRRRGLYAGAFGLVGFGGYVNLGLCIRGLTRHGDEYVTRASAGVVADSVPEREWRETLAKMSATYWAVTGTELT